MAVKGKIRIPKTVQKLGYLDEKPTVYRIRTLTMPVISGENLVQYVAKSANVPVSSIRAAVAAIAQGICYFVINGHAVHFNNFGTFHLNMQYKVAQTEEECTTKNIKRLVPEFIAHRALLDQLMAISFETYDTVSMGE